MTPEQANQIADLLNSRNNLIAPYTADKIHNYSNQYLFELEGEQVIACIRTRKVQWYQCEIRHLVVKEGFERRGLGRKMIELAEDVAKQSTTRVVQCTIRADNAGAEQTFRSCGYQRVSSFYYPKSQHSLGIWQKTICFRAEPALPPLFLEY